MPIDDRDYYLDLLFYHRKLRRLIAIDLKLGKFEAADRAVDRIESPKLLQSAISACFRRYPTLRRPAAGSMLSIRGTVP